MNEDQHQLIETMIGAAIWYLPQSEQLWTKKISFEAVKLFHPDSGEKKPKLSKEHEYPRKIAAMELLKVDWSSIEKPGEFLLSLYLGKYGKYTYVTSKENSNLQIYQRKGLFEGVTVAYQKANIKLIEINKVQLKEIKQRERSTIEILLQRF